MAYPLIFNDQFGLRMFKVQIYIPFIQYKILSIMLLLICTDKLFVLALPEKFSFLWQKLGFQHQYQQIRFSNDESISNRWLQKNVIKKLINKAIAIASQKSTRETIFPWHGQYFILVIIKEVDMKNSANIPILYN